MTLDESTYPVLDLLDNESHRHHKYYILGLMATGAMIRNGFLSIIANERDASLLTGVRQLLKLDAAVIVADGSASIHVDSPRLCDALSVYGITGERNNMYLKQGVPRKHIVDFLRGCFDGSGSITVSDETVKVTYLTCESGAFAEQVRQLCEYAGVKMSSSFQKSGVKALTILAWLYGSPGLFAAHKYEQFLELTRLSKHEHFMEIAYATSYRATCLRAKVGSILTDKDQKTIHSIGYNGSLPGSPNCCSGFEPGKCGCIHAERNLIEKCALVPGITECVLYCTTMPCLACSTLIAQQGIKQIVYSEAYRGTPPVELFEQNGISVIRVARDQYKWKLRLNEVVHDTDAV
jgi:dCMP deaminase